MKAAEYYDDYAARQVATGVTDRHRAIQRWLKSFGLAPGMDVLEIGCGVGMQTQLIAETLKGSGALVAVDLSPRSVQLAAVRLTQWQNVELLSADVVELSLDRVFDVIVMPDVIEHIPLEQHYKLFANVRHWLKDTGWVLIHMPNPFFLDWCHRNRPDLLQVIDQPVFTEALLANIQPHGLYIHYLNTYSIWVPEGDYQVILLKARRPHLQFHFAKTPLSVRRMLRMGLETALSLPKSRRGQMRRRGRPH